MATTPKRRTVTTRDLNRAINSVRRRQAARRIFGPLIAADRDGGMVRAAYPAAADAPPDGTVYRVPRQRRTSPDTVFIPRQYPFTDGNSRG